MATGQLVGAIKARWICEQAHQRLKEELGLAHFEGRSWTGLHRHALMTMMAYAFLQTRRLAQAGRKKGSPARHLNPACQRSPKPSLKVTFRDKHSESIEWCKRNWRNLTYFLLNFVSLYSG
jgi:hypothetical protein